MRHRGFIALCLTAIVVSIYLFATAPVPLEARNARAETVIPVERVFDTVNDINAKARQIYTEEIVGAGKAAGLAFDEDWREDAVEAGPLPALFLRTTAARLERDPVELGLFLGSDQPINASNVFIGEQLAQFELLKIDGRPRYARGEGTMFGMYADVASAQACVTCHNEHRDTPKADWRLGDVMGATTWTYPRQAVSIKEYIGIIDTVYSAIGEVYEMYLAEVEDFEKKPVIGERWPRHGFFLPDTDTFMAVLREATAPGVIVAITEDALAGQGETGTGLARISHR